MGSPVAPIKRGARGRPSSSVPLRAQLAERLASRRAEIEAAALTRIHAISDPAETEDPSYVEGLRVALVAAVDYGLAAVELGEERCPPPPPALLVQARMAARAGVSLDTVLRRYFAGYSLLGDFLIEEVEAAGVRGPELKAVLRAQATLFERMLAAVSKEHGREAEERAQGTEERRAEQVERLLAGELVDTSGLDYDFEGHHLGLIASGIGALEAARDLASSLDRRLLCVRRDETTVWAWLGGRRRAEPGELGEAVGSGWPVQISLALGEPGEGLGGWRLTHRQARAALTVARYSSASVIRYMDVVLSAAIVNDDLLKASLIQLFLFPLERVRGGGGSARQTLSAYFSADRNISSTAAALGVSRKTVASRLRSIEAALGRRLSSCAPELEAALRLAEFAEPLSLYGYDTGERRVEVG